MRRTVDRTNALKAGTAPGVLEMLQSSNTSLEKIHKCLEVCTVSYCGLVCALLQSTSNCWLILCQIK